MKNEIDSNFRKVGVLLVIVGVLLGKFGVVDVLHQARQLQDSVAINWLATLACGVCIPLGLLFTLLGRRLQAALKINQETGKASVSNVALAAVIFTPAVVLCLYVQYELRKLGYGS